MLVLILVSMERRCPYLYTGSKFRVICNNHPPSENMFGKNPQENMFGKNPQDREKGAITDNSNNSTTK